MIIIATIFINHAIYGTGYINNLFAEFRIANILGGNFQKPVIGHFRAFWNDTRRAYSQYTIGRGCPSGIALNTRKAFWQLESIKRILVQVYRRSLFFFGNNQGLKKS